MSMLSSVELRKGRLHIRSILVPTDFSSASERALQVAQMLAVRYKAELHVVHVLAPEAYSLRPPEGVATVHDIGRTRATTHFQRIRAANNNLGIRHDEVVREGETWGELTRSISENDIDLIVVGTHGAGGLEKLVLGSVAEEIFRKAPCPVITVGPHVAPEIVGPNSFREILAPVDFTAQSRAALPFALMLASDTESHLTLLHVAEDPVAPEPHSEAILSEAYTKRLLELVPEGVPHPKTRVGFGHAADVIVDTATALGSGLIVLGVRSTGDLASHLPWAVTSQVVRKASCPILTVRSDVRERKQ